MEITKVAGIGTGLMGIQVGMCIAKYGFPTKVYSRTQEGKSKAENWIRTYLDGRIEKKRITTDERSVWESNIQIVTDLAEAVGDADIVIESAPEDAEIKKEYFRSLDEYTKPECILATNSSSMPSSMFAFVTKKPDKVCNMHFFNPALVMELVEVVRGEHTSDDTANTVYELAKTIGKTPILMQKEIPGFVVTKLIGAMQNVAFELVEGGYVTPQEFDIAQEKGMGHPMGVFRLLDLTGIDLLYMARRASIESGFPAYLPQFVTDQYNTGNYGRKTGKGWYDY